MYNALRCLDSAASVYEGAGELGEKLARELREAMVRLGWDGRPLPAAGGDPDGLTVMDLLDHIKNGGAIRRREWVRMGHGWEDLRVTYGDAGPALVGFDGTLRPEIAMLHDWEVVP